MIATEKIYQNTKGEPFFSPFLLFYKFQLIPGSDSAETMTTSFMVSLTSVAVRLILILGFGVKRIKKNEDMILSLNILRPVEINFLVEKIY